MPILDAVIYLVKATKSKLDKLVDPYPSLFTGLMALLLEAISKILENKDKLYEAMNIANEAINHWIKGTIGGEMFGKEVSSWLSSKQLTKLKDEFGVRKHWSLGGYLFNLGLEAYFFSFLSRKCDSVLDSYDSFHC